MTPLTPEIEVGSEVPTCLYRCFAEGDVLLYVGISGNLTTRMRYHAKHATWWRRCRRRTVTLYATRAAAEDAESAAILGENPLFNKLGRATEPTPAPATRTRLTAAERRLAREAAWERARIALDSWLPAHRAKQERLAKKAGMSLKEYLNSRSAA